MDKPQKIQFDLMPFCNTDRNKLAYIRALEEFQKHRQNQQEESNE